MRVREFFARLRARYLGRPADDPFETFEVQARLTRLRAELLVLDGSGKREFAAAHHERAALMAYERTLDEALALAGLPPIEGQGPAHRLMAEVVLAEAGWNW